jgi:hypothetical protein
VKNKRENKKGIGPAHSAEVHLLICQISRDDNQEEENKCQDPFPRFNFV